MDAGVRPAHDDFITVSAGEDALIAGAGNGAPLGYIWTRGCHLNGA
jgi:hypothetical protein